MNFKDFIKNLKEGHDIVYSSDYRTTPSGRKVRARRLVFKNAEPDRNDQAPVAPSIGNHRIAVTTSEPDHPMVSKRKETTQRFVRVFAHDKDTAIEQGMKHFKKKGFKVHGAEHVGMIHEETISESQVEFRLDNRDKIKGDHKPTFAEHEAKISDATDKAVYVKVPSHKADSFKNAMKVKHGVTAELAEETNLEFTEDIEHIDEMINEILSKDATAGDWIHDFIHSKDPKFAGKSKEKRKQMALAAYYAKQRNEAVDNHHSLWKYNKITGFWSHIRNVSPETKNDWLRVHMKDEPDEHFVVSRNKPYHNPIKENVNMPGDIEEGVDQDKQVMTEISDYFRRRKREEEIISGKRPARKKQPAQTSDYAKRRAQEKKQGMAEVDKHSLIGKIQRGHELKKKVDSSWKDIGDAQKAGDKAAGSRAFRKHERYANLERPGTWTKVDEQGVAEGKSSDKLAIRHQDIRKQSGLPHPDYYKEMSKSYDIEDDAERRAHQADIRKKYGLKENFNCEGDGMLSYKKFVNNLLECEEAEQVVSEEYEEVEQIDETAPIVHTANYTWGKMKTIHQGRDFSIPLHPEHHEAIAKLKHNQEHKFKDETGRHWIAKRQGNVVHFQSADLGGNLKTTVSHQSMKEEVEQIDEAKRIISTHGTGIHTAKVYRDPEYNEYQVHYFKNGKHMGEGPVSYHNDKSDAQSTAEHGLKRMNAMKEESGMLSYKDFINQLNEYESKGGVYVHKGTYGTSYQGDDEEEENETSSQSSVKRGRGRPAGSKSGARQKGSASGKSHSGVSIHSLHLPKTK